MKKTLLIFIVIIFILTVGCYDNYVTKEEYGDLQEVNREILDEYSKLEEDRNNLKSEVYDLEGKLNLVDENLQLTEEELEKYKDLLGNLNNLLGNVYYGYANNVNWESDGFTAFSIEYKERYYLVTAGHCVHYVDENVDTGVYTYFKFKANFSDEWIYPKLLKYENDFDNGKDYAVFFSDKINDGLEVDYDDDRGVYILGNNRVNINVIRNIRTIGIEGESGSPIVDINGEVVGISIVDYSRDYTPIQLVLDNIE